MVLLNISGSCNIYFVMPGVMGVSEWNTYFACVILFWVCQREKKCLFISGLAYLFPEHSNSKVKWKKYISAWYFDIVSSRLHQKTSKKLVFGLWLTLFAPKRNTSFTRSYFVIRVFLLVSTVPTQIYKIDLLLDKVLFKHTVKFSKKILIKWSLFVA